MSSSAEIRPLLDRFGKAPEAVAEKVRNLSKEQMTYRPFPEAWTIHEHLVHMADSELNGSVRLRKILAESGVAVDVFDQEKWVASLNYHRQPAERALALFRLLREIALDLLRAAPEAAWDANHILHPERGKVSLRDWLAIYVEHSDTHLHYIERNLKMWSER
jgi:uncharacterized damage-inducible protein DinB